MTQRQLIDKWRKKADYWYEVAKIERERFFEPERAERAEKLGDIYTDCADDLEALTY